MIFKIVSPKNSAKKLAFLTQNKGTLCKILIITLVFEKNAIFFAENCRKLQKIVTSGANPWTAKTKGKKLVALLKKCYRAAIFYLVQLTKTGQLALKFNNSQ
jgi:hypothetical protein